MRRIPRWLVFTAIVVVLVLGTAASVGIATVRQSFPQVSGRLVLPGLNAGVEVLRDSYGVPQIYADNPEDLFEAQGYVQAQDRFYEMDFRRHLAAGRLSELYGPSQVEADTFIRTLGWRRVAEQELNLLAPSTRRYLDAYASGVNSYLHGRSAGELSLEYTLLGVQGLDYTPEDWTAADSVSWLKVMAWDLGANYDQEIERAIITARLGAARTAEIYPSYPYNGYQPIVAEGTIVGKVFDPTARRVPARPFGSAPGRAELQRASSALAAAARIKDVIPRVLASSGGFGSNSWAVSGSRTASGKAILSNDPHLETSIPSIFAQVGLHCRTVSTACPFDVTGFSLASVPGVVIGRNAQIAWGLTTSYVDGEDLYLEDVRDNTVREGNRYVPLQVRTEEIRVQGEDQPRVVTIRASRHGPLMSDVAADVKEVGAAAPASAAQPYAVALSWVALTPGRTMDALLDFDEAHNFTEFRAAAALLSAPSQNLMYADTAGNIGYQLPGAVPIRGKGDGEMPSPGWDPSYDWHGLVPFAQLPYAYNPPNGMLVAANQPVIGNQYPLHIGSNFSPGWRSQEIRDRLTDAPPLTMDSAEQLFYDDTIPVAADIVPALLKIKVSDPWVAEGQRTLVGWDYSASADSAAAAYFHVVMHNIYKLAFRDELAEEQWPADSDRWYAVVAELIKQPRSAWWDDVTTTGKVETRDDILLAAMTSARKEITSLMARDTDEWQWGKLHTLRLRNQTLGESGIAPVEALFNRGHYRLGGGPAVVDATGYSDTSGYAVNYAPTMRMLVDLGSPDGSRWVNETGESGHAFDRNYDDQTTLWAEHRMWPLVLTRTAVDARTQNRLELIPGG